MSEISKRLMKGTSKPVGTPAALVLEDGAVFRGTSCAAAGEVFGEICFNTSLEGYLEVITDPSYAGQIIAMTYPQIGNYGVNEDDAQSDEPALRGLVVRDLCTTPSNWRSAQSLPDYLRAHGVVAVEGVDTRALVRHVRDRGAQRAVLSTVDVDEASLLRKVRESASLVGQNLAATVSCARPYRFAADRLPASQAFALAAPLAPRFKVAAYDCGAKRSILENLVRAGCDVTCVPWDTPAADVLALAPDGVFLSNGPGDPEAVEGTFTQVEQLLGRVPVFGICLGHQMIAKAAGADIEKLKFGHRGGNHPVMNLRTRRVEITAQNHGFGLVFPSLGALVPELSGGVAAHEDDLRCWVERGVAPVVANKRFGRIQLTHVNLNDGTAEGVAFLDIPAFSVQYHPEASPGPTDAHYLFTAFARLMEGRKDYLDIDIAEDRLAGWSFASSATEQGFCGEAQRLEGSATDELSGLEAVCERLQVLKGAESATGSRHIGEEY
ncbi:glutamine-hydrolyzing carbamoyl-phosphate synthase small subunit [Eggerthella guodeyinii]|uniref:glutamine-hydrolyzing carbamoyl-phosphate synthase small subunit n=1 Tax=Eggerthella guodeyinii TaxID=2690837 RepID=UPI001F462231|nr:glutamine-hydrolyzing carbamoyl-phosphate synthase small subunit [Eggerthella guodeyinii]